VFANDLFTLMLFHERGIRAVEAPLYRRNEMRATEVRKRMASGETWEDLVPVPVSKVIKEIKGAERVRALLQRDLPSHVS
jgi:nicotinamide-nucleotide adenylyltransferase